jgi:hypothetical protein
MSIRYPTKPSPWNIDPSLVHPEVYDVVQKSKILLPVLTHGNTIMDYKSGLTGSFGGATSIIQTEFGPALNFDGTSGTKVNISTTQGMPALIETQNLGYYWTLTLCRPNSDTTVMDLFGSSSSWRHGVRFNSGATARISLRAYCTGTSIVDGAYAVGDLLLIYTEHRGIAGQGGRICLMVFNLTQKTVSSNIAGSTSNENSTSFALGGSYSGATTGTFDGQIYYFLAGSHGNAFSNLVSGGTEHEPIISEKILTDPFILFRNMRDVTSPRFRKPAARSVGRPVKFDNGSNIISWNPNDPKNFTIRPTFYPREWAG